MKTLYTNTKDIIPKNTPLASMHKYWKVIYISNIVSIYAT